MIKPIIHYYPLKNMPKSNVYKKARMSGFSFMLQAIMAVTIKVGNHCGKVCTHTSTQRNINSKQTFLVPIPCYIDGLLYIFISET